MVLHAAKLAIAYFLLVFGAGFLLGPPRVLLLEPRLGERVAQLVEMPLMLFVIWFAARLVVRRVAPLATAPPRLGAGIIATLLILAADVAVGVFLRGMSLAGVFVERDPLVAVAYYGSLAFCALAPWLAGRRLGGSLARTSR